MKFVCLWDSHHVWVGGSKELILDMALISISVGYNLHLVGVYHAPEHDRNMWHIVFHEADVTAKALNHLGGHLICVDVWAPCQHQQPESLFIPQVQVTRRRAWHEGDFQVNLNNNMNSVGLQYVCLYAKS